MKGLGALLWARARIAANTVASVREESKVKVAFVSISALLLLAGIFFGARFGIRLFEAFGAEFLGVGGLRLGDLVMSRLLATLALAVFVLLIVSNVLVVYATLYRSREMPFLVQSPLPVSTLFLGRFAEAVSFSSWATAFLGAPVLLAYGLEVGAPWPFYAALVFFYLPFVIIPAAIGAIVSLLLVQGLVRGLAKLRHRVVPLGVVGAAAAIAFYQLFRDRLRPPDLSDPASFQAIVDGLAGSQSPFLPSQWLAEGLLAIARGDFASAGFSLLLLVSNAAFFLFLAVLVAEAFFYDGWTALLASDEERPRDPERRGILGRLDDLLFFVPEPTRSLVVKDLRLFWRDPSQWSQFLILFGILALYLANLGQSAPSSLDAETWRAWGTLLNVGASLLILASLTTRFVFPLISLEGRRMWILGLSPVPLRRVMRQKFALSVALTASFTLPLTVLSAWQLDLDGTGFAVSLFAVAATTLALSGLAVGLGSLYPDFEADDPSRAVSGLGGTLNFILSMVYVVLATAGLGVVLLWSWIDERFGARFAPDDFSWAVALVVAWILGLTAVACFVPLRLGLRHLEALEI